MKRLLETTHGEHASGWFATAIIEWQRRNGRHALPWQQTREPYRIWLSEIMLQQTQVATVIPYYQRFLQRYPDVLALANAPVEDVMALWAGLGYYTRARNLHRCAQQVRDDYQGQFPTDPVLLESLPGIGRSTAAAIAAFSTGARAAILDGNVKRVFARVFGIEGFPGTREVEKAMWARAQALLPAQGMEAYTQGLMDLGATVCTRTRPTCLTCPVAQQCVARREGRTAELPTARVRKAVPRKAACMAIVLQDDTILLERRPPSGIWGGLLSLPEVPLVCEPESAQCDAAAAQLLARLLGSRHASSPEQAFQWLTPLEHAFTHYRLTIYPCVIRSSLTGSYVAEDALQWMPLAQASAAGLPAPVQKLLSRLSAADL